MIEYIIENFVLFLLSMRRGAADTRKIDAHDRRLPAVRNVKYTKIQTRTEGQI